MSMSFSADPSGTFGTIKVNGVSQVEVHDDGTLRTPAGKVVGTSEGILGTVSQLAGVPTGAIIERGSNANGEYVKFADGTLICTFMESSLSSCTVSTGITGMFISGNIQRTFSSAFIDPPICKCIAMSVGNTVWAKEQSITSTTVYTQAIGTPSGATAYIGYIAIGRWF